VPDRVRRRGGPGGDGGRAASAGTRSSAPDRHPLVRVPPTVSFAAGNRAAAIVIQRETRSQARSWLRTFLAGGAASGAAGMARAAARMGAWSSDRQAHLIRGVRGNVDGFELAVGRAGLLGDANAGRVIGILESAQPTAALGTRLVTLFRASVDAVLGLVIAANTPEDRLRASMETTVGSYIAIGDVLRRNPVAGTPAPLRRARDLLAQFEREFADPSNAGVTATSAGREARIEAILTPPAVAHARAAAAAAGLPPPAFIPAGYYRDLIAALHTAMLGSWAWAEPKSRRRALDASPGGHIEGIATEAKARVDALFGDYGSRPAPSLTFAAANLEDRAAIVGDAFDMARWYVNEGSDHPAIDQVKQAHHAFEDAAAAQVIEDRIISHYSGRTAPATAADRAAVAALGMPTAERQRRLLIIDRMWPGVQSRGTVSVAAREGASRRETRGIYWGLFKTMIHEYLHTTENATYQAWYGALRDSHHQTTFQEGVTDLFTLQTWRSLMPAEISANRALRARIQGPADADLDMAAVGGDPGAYAQLAEAQQIQAEIGIANLRAAYFRGNTAVLGGTRLPR
jgi:hypothetical protein